jgi:hypothetical protein
MNGKIRFWMLGVAGCLISAAALSILLTPGAALAKGKPPGGGGGNGQFNTQGYWVWFSQDSLVAFAPEGPRPVGSAEDAINGGASKVVAGAIGDPNDPRMIVNFNQSCLPSFPGGSMTHPWALLLDVDFESPDNEVFLDCFPAPSLGAIIISADGTTVQMNIHGLSKSGRDMGYQLIIEVLPTMSLWDPLEIAPGISANLDLGAWTLTTSNPKQQSKGCSASGDFSNDFVAITVSRWTLDEQAAQDACE